MTALLQAAALAVTALGALAAVAVACTAGMAVLTVLACRTRRSGPALLNLADPAETADDRLTGRTVGHRIPTATDTPGSTR